MNEKYEKDIWSEKDRQKKPQNEDYIRVYEVLRDFGIKRLIPRNFTTVADLERWQRKVILGN